MLNGTAVSGIVRVLGCPQQSKSGECEGAYEPLPQHTATSAAGYPIVSGIRIECMVRLSSYYSRWIGDSYRLGWKGYQGILQVIGWKGYQVLGKRSFI